MLKSMITTSLITLTLLMSGCGGNNEGESVLETQKMLDDGDFTGVITKLEGSATSDDDYINLASAYMGRSGLTLTNLVTSILNANESTSGDIGFANFIKAIDSTSTSTALVDLRKASLSYKEVIGNGCDNTSLLSTSQKDICLFIGLANTGSAAVAVSTISEDLNSFGVGSGSDNKLQASVCAMTYSRDGSYDNTLCTLTAPDAPVTFTQISKTYTAFDFSVGGENFKYLKNDGNQTVMTQDYCLSTDFATRTETLQAGYYACPINEVAGEEDLTTSGVLVEVLNNGLNAVSSAVNDDMQTDIDTFKCEVLGGNFNGTSCDKSGDISESDIVTYLNQQNQ